MRKNGAGHVLKCHSFDALEPPITLDHKSAEMIEMILNGSK